MPKPRPKPKYSAAVLAEIPPARFEHVATNNMSAEDRFDALRECDAMMQALARWRGYLSVRDSGHAAGVKESNELVRDVRKLLGYAYPDDSLSF